jgi:predicted TIM-barrel fold metal-dependent hydrolase
MAQTPWGEIPIFDAHMHFFSPVFFNALGEQKAAPVETVAAQLGWDAPQSPEALADRWVAEMDRNGVDRAMLIASVPNDTASVGIALARHPGRFRAVYMTNPMLPCPDIRFEHAVAEDGVSGIFLFPAMHRYSMHADKACAMVQMIAGHPGALVYVHCGALSLGFRKKLGLPSHFDLRYSNPIDLHDLAGAHPSVKFVIPHFGAGYFREALMLADLCPNVYLDTSSSNGWMRCQTEDLTLERVFAKALSVVGPNRLLFGSDSSWFPRGWVRPVFDAQVKALANIGADEATARAIFGGNLMRIAGGRGTISAA